MKIMGYEPALEDWERMVEMVVICAAIMLAYTVGRYETAYATNEIVRFSCRLTNPVPDGKALLSQYWNGTMFVMPGEV